MTTKRLYGAKTKRRTYTVTEEVHEALCQLGKQASGKRNASAGIREAVRRANDTPSP